MIQNAIAAQPWINTPGGHALPAAYAPEGPADKVMRTLNAFASAVRDARAAGWTVSVTTEQGEISVHASKQTIVTLPAT